MLLKSTHLPGVTIIDIEKKCDERGFFARSFCLDELSQASLAFKIVQTNISFNTFKGTLRGMHLQLAPHGEAKVVRCVRGAIYDVALDLRPNSRMFGKWVGIELSSDNYTALHIPPGVAHGFQTLEDNTEVHYLMSEFFHPESAAGVRWDDPTFCIDWPIASPIVSQKDATLPNFADQDPGRFEV